VVRVARFVFAGIIQSEGIRSYKATLTTQRNLKSNSISILIPMWNKAVECISSLPRLCPRSLTPFWLLIYRVVIDDVVSSIRPAFNEFGVDAMHALQLIQLSLSPGLPFSCL
jgi:hypothetical protein